MMDLARLDEALGGSWVVPNDSERGKLETILVAARAYRGLANGERVEWCEQHRSVVPQGWVWCETADANIRGGACRIVSKLIIDDPEQMQ